MVNGFEIRLAEDHEGQQILSLLKAEGYPMDIWAKLDWTKIKPFWLVAAENDKILAAIQVAASKPVSHIEFMVSRKGMPHRQKATIIKQLLISAMAMVKTLGGGCVSGLVPNDPEYRSYKRMLKHRGARVCQTGNMVMRLV